MIKDARDSMQIVKHKIDLIENYLTKTIPRVNMIETIKKLVISLLLIMVVME